MSGWYDLLTGVVMFNIYLETYRISTVPVPSKQQTKRRLRTCQKSHELAIKIASCSSAIWSSSVKPDNSAQSISMIATTYLHVSLARVCCIKLSGYRHTIPSWMIGTTISLLLAPSQAMCPGNLSTSSTNWVTFFATAVPHTPRPMAIVWHATWPLKGPRINCFGFLESMT